MWSFSFRPMFHFPYYYIVASSCTSLTSEHTQTQEEQPITMGYTSAQTGPHTNTCNITWRTTITMRYTSTGLSSFKQIVIYFLVSKLPVICKPPPPYRLTSLWAKIEVCCKSNTYWKYRLALFVSDTSGPAFHPAFFLIGLWDRPKFVPRSTRRTGLH
jgi:hypothetical protein